LVTVGVFLFPGHHMGISAYLTLPKCLPCS